MNESIDTLHEVEGESSLSANRLHLGIVRRADGCLYFEATLTAHDESSSWGEALPLGDVLEGLFYRRP